MANKNIVYQPTRVIDGERNLVNNSFIQIASLATVTSLTVPADARYAVIQCEGADVRWTPDGTTPSATVGFILEQNMMWTCTEELESLKFIQASATASLNIAFYK